MKLALFDPYSLKFTRGMKEWWETHGHEVQYQQYYNPQLVEWADVVYFETCDNNLKSATKPGEAILGDDANYSPWDMHDMDLSNKQIIVRPIDIEVWQGHHLESRWDVVDDVVFIANHIRNLAQPDSLPERKDSLRVHTIPCGVDLEKFTFAERQPGFDIAIVSEKWNSKGTHLLLQVILKLTQLDSRYRFHWLGQRSDTPWEYAYFDDFVEHHHLPIEFTNILNDGTSVNDFLEGKNYLLHGSIKEGFSYATAEAMAKGIKPVVHRFFGADDIWENTWDSIDQAVDMITSGTYDSQSYRQYLIDHRYTLPQMMESIDSIINKEV